MIRWIETNEKISLIIHVGHASAFSSLLQTALVAGFPELLCPLAAFCMSSLDDPHLSAQTRMQPYSASEQRRGNVHISFAAL